MTREQERCTVCFNPGTINHLGYCSDCVDTFSTPTPAKKLYRVVMYELGADDSQTLTDVVEFETTATGNVFNIIDGWRKEASERDIVDAPDCGATQQDERDALQAIHEQ